VKYLKLLRSIVIAAISVSLLASCTGNKKPAELAVDPEAPFVLQGVRDFIQVEQLTGYDSKNKTNEYDVFGTDLGSMFNVGDKTYIVFGDTFGYRSSEKTGAGGSDWRSNTLAVTTDNDPSDGLTIDRMITDYGKHAKEVIPSAKVNNQEMTKIPTHGIAVGDNLYLYFMSVYHWGTHGNWVTNYSGLTKSKDQGEHWEILEDVKWPGDSNFIQVSPYKIKISEELTEIYLWAIPAGRFGGVQLMKVDERFIEDINQYKYFAGLDDRDEPIWSTEMDEAITIVEGNVGELSVIWNPYLERWIMMYLKEGTGVVMHEGITPWGPWSDPITVIPKEEYPGLYGPYMNEKYLEDNGKTIYFTLSLWGPYNVFWMKVTLDKAEN
jgi:hypothetical protein